METNKAIAKAKEKAEDLIRDITRKEHISPAELEAVMKSVCLIMKVEGANGDNDDYDNGFSEGSYRRGRSPITGQYVSRDGGVSNRGYYDSNGAYRSFDGASGNSSRRYYDGGSRNSGYSGHSKRDRMIAALEEMYDNAQTNHEREFVQEWLERLSR